MKQVSILFKFFLLTLLTSVIACTKELDENTKTIVYGMVTNGNTGRPLTNAKVYVEYLDHLAPNGPFVKTDSTLTNVNGNYEVQFYGGMDLAGYGIESYIKVVHPDTINTNIDNGPGIAIQTPVFGGINKMNFVLY